MTQAVRLINVRNIPDGVDPASVVYIGRTAGGFRRSKWANPYPLRGNGEEHTRAAVIAKYERFIRNRPDLLAALPELRGKVLACWCYPLPCHGDVLLRLLDEGVGAAGVTVGPLPYATLEGRAT